MWFNDLDDIQQISPYEVGLIGVTISQGCLDNPG
jgi:hypothetical protein